MDGHAVRVRIRAVVVDLPKGDVELPVMVHVGEVALVIDESVGEGDPEQELAAAGLVGRSGDASGCESIEEFRAQEAGMYHCCPDG